jgi:hypothetical protein
MALITALYVAFLGPRAMRNGRETRNGVGRGLERIMLGTGILVTWPFQISGIR